MRAAANRGAGWSMMYLATLSASQLLMLVEYASFNMRSNIGDGVSYKADDGVSSCAEITG